MKQLYKNNAGNENAEEYDEIPNLNVIYDCDGDELPKDYENAVMIEDDTEDDENA